MNKSSNFSTLLEKGFKLGLSNIWRNKVLSLATIFVIAIIIFVFNIILAINFIATDAIQNISEKVDVTVYLKETTKFSEVQKITEDLETLDGVIEIKYISKNDAIEKIKKTNPNLLSAFEKYKLGNPLPASLSIKTENIEQHKTVTNFLNQDQYKKYLSSVLSAQNSEENAIISSVSKNLEQVSKFTNQIIFWLFITFLIGGTLIVINALQLTIFTRKKEIQIMKLVGASHWFIRLPFIIESIIYGILAVIISFTLLLIVSNNLESQFTTIANQSNAFIITSIFIIELALTTLLCTISSLIAVHKEL